MGREDGVGRWGRDDGGGMMGGGMMGREDGGGKVRGEKVDRYRIWVGPWEVRSLLI